MKNRRADIALFIFIVFVFSFTAPSVVFSADSDNALPEISLPKTVIDLGRTFQGEKASGNFIIRNSGAAPLKLIEIKPSCGCTVAEPATKAVEPGGEVAVSVQVDTAGKVGRVRKGVEITTNDPVTPVTSVEILVDVILPEHVDMKNGRLFKGDCARCHAVPAGGLEGEPLFEAVCAFCHGHYGLGRSSASADSALRINSLDYLETHKDDYIRGIIKEGKQQTSMPGFGKAAGGPLSKDQINSLVKLIRWWQEGFVFKKNEERSYAQKQR